MYAVSLIIYVNMLSSSVPIVHTRANEFSSLLTCVPEAWYGVILCTLVGPVPLTHTVHINV